MWISETVVAWLFLWVSLVGAVFTLNAFMPVRRIPALFVPSFFGSWLTAELALHHIVWQSIATVSVRLFRSPVCSGPGSSAWGLRRSRGSACSLSFTAGTKHAAYSMKC